jgi:hypothetical protein
LKKFDKDGKNFEFKKRGLAIAIHIVINENFNAFYKDLTNLDFKNKCIINFYKNSLVDLEFLKKVYPTYSKKFIKNIKKINKRYKFSNSIFKNYF